MCSPIEDQGSTSSCTGHAIVGALEYNENLLRDQSAPFVPLSRLFVYYNERAMEGDPERDEGAEIRDGITSIAQYGVCRESIWPFSMEDLLIKPSQAAYDDAQKFKALSYQRLPQTEAAILHCLALSKQPIVMGIQVFPSFESEQVAKTGFVPMPTWSEQSEGGHAVLCVGANQTTRLFTFRNSWGPDWGDQGYFYLPFEYVLRPDLTWDLWMIEKISQLG